MHICIMNKAQDGRMQFAVQRQCERIHGGAIDGDHRYVILRFIPDGHSVSFFKYAMYDSCC